ncbi:phage tail protein [Sphingomonas sp. AOB5]|uniref:phage tail protein n=1 Tax=Sphingomonas sp. AOB5 TaxID=3034017 RepID=UPI0023F7FE1A|nr:phage tail protein [Sphingomonas sp. AOB5]MDF7777221.1 phage tail protein [Sphingomonas sp. AOB5]
MGFWGELYPTRNHVGMIHHFLGLFEFGSETGGHPIADGRKMEVDKFSELHAEIRSEFGGDSRYFHLPDLAGKALIGRWSKDDPGLRWTVAVNWLICAKDAWLSGRTPCIGMMRPILGDSVPPGWLVADGRMLPVEEYEELSAIIGKRFGGNGRTEFALPDMRGRTPVGIGNGVKLGDRIGTVDPDDRSADGAIAGLGLSFWIVGAGIPASYDHQDYFGMESPTLGELVIMASASGHAMEEWFMLDGATLPLVGKMDGYSTPQKINEGVEDVLHNEFGGVPGETVRLPDAGGKMLVGMKERGGRFVTLT